MYEEFAMIHRYQLNGYNIVLDVCSGSIHAVDELTDDAPDFITSAVADFFAGPPVIEDDGE